MRCRKVRSFLSAYCNGELSGTQNGELRHHLDDCPDCRKEEQVYRELSVVTKKLNTPAVSDDFNTRLLNRISEERYKETRRKAYLPKKAPLFGLRTVVPVAATACLVLAFVLAGGFGPLMTPEQPMMAQDDQPAENRLDDSYATVKPTADHALTQHVDQQWAFDQEMARANRIRGYMNQLAGGNSFGGFNQMPMGGTVIMFQRNGSTIMVPMGQPIIRNFITPRSNVVREVQETY